MPSSVIVIPSRYDSTRFPGKPLAEIAGVSLLQRVWRIASAVNNVDTVLVATDDERIAKHATGFGAEVVMTSSKCRNGTERAYQAIENSKLSPDIVINFQGDTPLIPPHILQALVDFMREHQDAQLATPAVKLSAKGIETYLANTRAGKVGGTFVTFDKQNRALYFSKNVIPFPREKDETGVAPVYKHIGIYAYAYKTLTEYLTLEPGVFEVTEGLEQLRALENGIPIDVVHVDFQGRTAWSVDNPEDVEAVEKIIATEGELL